MKDKPKSGMTVKKKTKMHTDMKEDKKLVKKMVKGKCIK